MARRSERSSDPDPDPAVIDDLTALRRARSEFERLLAGVTDAHRSLPTPCADWDVAALIQHVIDGDTFAAMLLDGSSLHDAITALMGMDDERDFAAEADALDAAFAAAPADAIVDHPIGETTVADFLEFRTTDYAGHAWDLARATDQDEVLDPELVESLWTRSEKRVDTFATSEHFGGGPQASSHAPTDQPLQTRWLDRLGRTV